MQIINQYLDTLSYDLYSQFLNINDHELNIHDNHEVYKVTFGARVDSIYEYF